MTTTNQPLRVFTIGHSNHPTERLFELLRRHAVTVLIDVRSRPYSRHNPQYNREPFAEAVAAAGFRYEFQGNRLGGRPTDPACYVRVDTGDGSTRETDEVDYGLLSQRPWFQEGVAGVQALAGEEQVVLLCAEEDPERCHRHHFLTRALVERGVEVHHIRGTGEIEPADLDPELRQLKLF